MGFLDAYGTTLRGDSVFESFFATTVFSGNNTRKLLWKLGVKDANKAGKKIKSEDIRLAVSDIIMKLGRTVSVDLRQNLK